MAAFPLGASYPLPLVSLRPFFRDTFFFFPRNTVTYGTRYGNAFGQVFGPKPYLSRPLPFFLAEVRLAQYFTAGSHANWTFFFLSPPFLLMFPIFRLKLGASTPSDRINAIRSKNGCDYRKEAFGTRFSLNFLYELFWSGL